MASKAARMRTAAAQRSNNAERALVAAVTSLRTQEMLVERLRTRGQDVSAMEARLASLRELVAIRRTEAERETAALARLREMPDWQLNGD